MTACNLEDALGKMEVFLRPPSRHTEMELRVRAHMDEVRLTGLGGRAFLFSLLCKIIYFLGNWIICASLAVRISFKMVLRS